MAYLMVNDWVRIFLISILAYLAYIDLRTFRLPDVITLPLILIGLCFNSLSSHQFVDLQASFIGALLGYLALWLLNHLYRYLKKREGIGMGDAKLLSALGAWLGWSAMPNILLLASLSGMVGGVLWLRLNKQHHGSPFPFGPFLSFAGIIELLWPQSLQNLLLSNLS